ncbi:MAG: hypothetical protein COV76_05265 [Candidatus Omnitrophica bacterium CG11_big_fil_rev_8_21_14_0_20_64_10]|nr:MAG: hypothetical protein COV76_05265 [Candidatus Omnitrophica bacterium CG11_big_fil_rev_8_21_14_0_20_64_10]
MSWSFLRVAPRLAALLLLFSLASPVRAEPLELFEVERSRTVSVPTQGEVTRTLILRPDVVAVERTTPTEIVFTGLAIGDTLVHLWDDAGRRTLRLRVTELQSIVDEIRQREEAAQARRLGIPDRTLKLHYRVTQEHLESGTGKVKPSETDENIRVRDQQMHAELGVPGGQLAADLYLETRRDTDIAQEVTQPRHMALTYGMPALAFLGPVEWVLGDRDITLSDFTLSGTRVRGGGLFPTPLRSGEKRTNRWELSVFGGQEREGFGLDSPAGQITRGDRNQVAGIRTDYRLFDLGTVHWTGLERHGDLPQDRADHVFETGLDLALFGERARVQGEVARNGTESASQLELALNPWNNLRSQHLLWRVGKEYKSVTGSTGREGQTGYDGSVEWILPGWDEALSLNGAVELYRDRNAVNPVNTDELNTTYAGGASIALPAGVLLNTGVSYADLSGASLPSVTKRADINLSKEILIEKGWLQGLSLSTGAERVEWSKSAGVVGFDGVLRLARAGVRARLIHGFWGGLSWALADLREDQPEAGNTNTVHPAQMGAELGWSRRFDGWTWPVNMNLSFRYQDAAETFSRTHQPFSDRDQLSGNLGIVVDANENQQMFLNLSAGRQTPQTGSGAPDVDIFLKFGMRTDWNTGWVLPRNGMVSGVLFEDLNANGKPDPEEPVRPGVRVSADDGRTTRTNGRGMYRLRVPEGERTIRVDWGEVPKGHYFTTPNTVTLLMVPGKPQTVHFGIATETEIRGRVYNDVNENGQYDEWTDQPVQGLHFQVAGGGSGVSGPLGFYQIRRIPPGEHTLTLVPTSVPNGYQTLAPIRTSWSGGAGEVTVYDMPLKARRTVWGRAFLDETENDQYETIEAPGLLPGVRVILDEAMVFTTGADGFYRIPDLSPGKHTIRLDPESLPSGCFLSPTASETIELDLPAEPSFREDLHFPIRNAETGPSHKEHLQGFWDRVGQFMADRWRS